MCVCLPISGRRGQDVLLFPSLVLCVPRVSCSSREKGTASRDADFGRTLKPIVRQSLLSGCQFSGQETSALSNHPFVCWDKKQEISLSSSSSSTLTTVCQMDDLFSSSSALLLLFFPYSRPEHRHAIALFSISSPGIFPLSLLLLPLFFFLSVPHRLTTHPVIAGSFLLSLSSAASHYLPVGDGCLSGVKKSN